ncbi:MAG TPA: glycosyl transferase family 1 [Sphingobacteriaceae bacterium]|nr:glycosyl transferase family 1 [Sphingobacteriaceae bacterium]
MKVTLINTSDSGGGAALACRRLMKALTLKDIDVDMLVQKKTSYETHIHVNQEHLLGKLKVQYDFLSERLPFIAFHEKDRSVRFAFSPANSGTDITAHHTISNADLLHLHWTNSGFLSIDNLKQVLNLKKPVIWTLHDMWTFTGGCHYTGSCEHFIHQCGNCPFLKDPGENDISHKGWLKKKSLYDQAGNIVFVTCSKWLADVAKKSSLLSGFRIETIPNPIDTTIFSPKDKADIRAKWNINPAAKIILFGAANIMDRRKGIRYLVDALTRFKGAYQDDKDVEIVIFGKNKSFNAEKLPFRVHNLSVISSQSDMAEIYSMADVFVLPSLEDNLPNTIMESMACGTPVVAFNTGGIPDMIDHQQNGYLAKYQDANDLALGMQWVFDNHDRGISANARRKVAENFSNDIVADKYIALYQSILHG